MCLILFAYHQHPQFPLIVIANRDEYYARPTKDAHWWDDAAVFAGRDLEACGTWLGVNRQGQFAAVTNVREPGHSNAAHKSRGALTRNYLATETTPELYLQQLAIEDQDYAGFNLLVGSASSLWFHSNRGQHSIAVKPGIFGISNGAYDEPWPKLSTGKKELEAQLTGDIDETRLMGILTDNAIADDHQLPSTGVSLDVERLLSSRFIRSPDYGTRACSVVMFDRHGQIHFHEQNFIDAETIGSRVSESFTISS